MSCARHKVAYLWGFLLVLVLVLVVAWSITDDRPDYEFKVPLWLVLLPVAYGVIYSMRSVSNFDGDLATEQVEFNLSGMSKRDYLNYKIGDDRTSKSFIGTATSAGLLSGTSLLAPFLRADR